MAVENDGFEMVQGPVEKGAEGEKSVSSEIGKLEQAQGDGEAIKFGSHGDESSKAEGNGVSDSNVPKNAVEEWTAPEQTHSFYFVRFRPYDDSNIKSEIDKLDKEINQKNTERFQLNDALKAKRSKPAELIYQIISLQQALGKLLTGNSAGQGELCSSEEELNDTIYSLFYRIDHENIPLSEEKQILLQIKQLEDTREEVIANAAMRAKEQDSIGQKEDIQDAVKMIGGNLDEMEKERETIRSKIKQLHDARKAIDKDIKSLEEELVVATQKRDEAFEGILQLRRQRDEGNTDFYHSRRVLNKARKLAAKKDINALEELSQTEVEKFMSLWSSDKASRNDYEKRILSYTRQLSRDGRMRNPDEKPLLEEPKPAETDTLPKSSAKQPKEEPKPSPQ